jgi:hypothetical protein
MPDANFNLMNGPAPPRPDRRNDEGFYLRDLANGSVVEIETQHRHYRLEKDDDTHVRISGHPTFCPTPTEVKVEGSFAAWPETIPKPGFIGRGMYLAFKRPGIPEVITTSRIREIHLVA